MQRGNFFFLCAFVSYLISTVLLQLLVELQGDADHHFGLVPIGVGDVVQDAIEVCGRNEKIKRVMIEGPPPRPFYSQQLDTVRARMNAPLLISNLSFMLVAQDYFSQFHK